MVRTLSLLAACAVCLIAAPAASAQRAAPATPAARPFWELFRPYGLIKPSVIFASSALESYSQPNSSAPTAAANPIMATAVDADRLTFQVAQSRLGLHFNEKGALRGQIELDFIDFSKASPTVASLPRLRILKVDWAINDSWLLSAGQDWDLHAPLNPHGANLVGGQFLSGNSAFMRQQVKAFYKADDFELGAALGLAAANAGAKEGNIELGSVPTGAVRAQWLSSAGNRVGISAIATSLRFDAADGAEERRLAGSAALFSELTTGRTNARVEAYFGRNAANLGLLALGTGFAGHDIDEWGGFVSVRQGFSEQHFATARAGIARVIDMADVRPSYTYAAGATVATAAGTGSGIRGNASVALGYEYRPLKPLGLVLEGTYFRTDHQLQVTDAVTVSGLREAASLELAAIAAF